MLLDGDSPNILNAEVSIGAPEKRKSINKMLISVLIQDILYGIYQMNEQVVYGAATYMLDSGGEHSTIN